MPDLIFESFNGTATPAGWTETLTAGGAIDHSSTASVTLTNTTATGSRALLRSPVVDMASNNDTVTIFVGNSTSFSTLFVLRQDTGSASFCAAILAAGANWTAQRYRDATGYGALAGTTTNRARAAYPWLRFRRVSATQIACEAAPDSSGSPGTWESLGTADASADSLAVSMATTRLDIMSGATDGSAGTLTIEQVGITQGLQLRFAVGAVSADTAVMTPGAGGGGGATWRGNEPAGLSSSNVTDFSTPTAWDFINGSHGSVSGENQAGTSPPRSGPLVARFQAPTGAFSGGGIGIAQAFIGQNATRVYTCALIRVSPNATLHPSAWKLWYHYGPGRVGSHVFLLEPIGSITTGGIRLKLETQGGRTPAANAASSPTVGVVTRGQWFQLETLIDTVAGVARAWVNGVLQVELTGGSWINTIELDFDPYYGGDSPGHTISTDTHILVDAAYASWGS